MNLVSFLIVENIFENIIVIIFFNSSFSQFYSVVPMKLHLDAAVSFSTFSTQNIFFP